MNSMEVMIEQMAAFAVLLLIGYFALKGKLWTKEELHSVSRFLVNIAIPLMVLTCIPFFTTREDLFSAGPFVLCSLLFVLLMYGAARLSARLARLKGDTADIHVAESTFSNGTFVGLPVTMAVLGEPGLIYWSIFAVLDHATSWSFGAYLASGRRPGQNNWRKMINPTTISLLLAIVLILIGWRPSGKIYDALKTVGSAVPYIAMIYVGGMLATFKASSVFTTKSLYWIVGIKMLLMPFVVYFLLTFCAGFLPVTAKFFLCLFAALPSMVALSMIAEANGSDAEYATKCIFLTTVFSIFSIPAVMYLIGFLENLMSA